MRDGWERVPLGDVTRQVIDPIVIDQTGTYSNLGLRMYAGGVFEREAKSGNEIKATRLFRVRAGQFIYNRLFAGGGSFGMVRPEHGHGVVSNEFPVFDVDPERLLAEYLYLHFQQPTTWDTVAEQCIGTTQTRLRWKEERFRAYTIPLPPLDEQRRIVDLVGALDDATEAADQSSEVGLYEALLRQLESSFAPAPIESVVAGAHAGGTPSRKQDQYFGGDIPWLKSGEVRQDSITGAKEHITEAGLANSSAKWVPPGATVVAMYGQGDTKGTAGFVSSPVTTNQAVLALLPDSEKVDPRYLLHAVRSQTPALRRRAVGAAQPNLSKSLVLSHPIPLPELASQRELADILDGVLSRRDGAREVRARLRTLRSNLLTVLLSGEHEIPASYDELMEEASS